jgi:uncharacterized protein (TIGR00369 family)
MTSNDEHFRKLERMYHGAPINRFFEPVLRISDGRAEITMPMKPDFFHAARAVHGSVYFKALDDAAFFAANSLVADVFVLTVTYSLYLTRPISEGEMRASGRVVHKSKNLLIADAELFDSADRQIARGSGTFMRSQIALSPAIGYA